MFQCCPRPLWQELNMLLRLPYMKLLGVSQIRTTSTSLQGPETGDTKPQQNPRARNYNQLCLWFLFWTEKNMNSGPGSGPILEPTGRPQKWDLLVPDNKAAPKQGTKCGPSAGTINLRELPPHFKFHCHCSTGTQVICTSVMAKLESPRTYSLVEDAM